MTAKTLSFFSRLSSPQGDFVVTCPHRSDGGKLRVVGAEGDLTICLAQPKEFDPF